MKRRLLIKHGALACTACLGWAGTRAAPAFDLAALELQLQAAPLSRGNFVQEKHLRGMDRPLTSHGRFVLVQGRGLLWLMTEPLRQDYRITPTGIARRQGDNWQALSARSASAQQNRLFLAVLAGDSSGLAEQFELALGGSAAAWTLVLTPRQALLRQIFTAIRIEGGRAVTRIELQETQGDRTDIRLVVDRQMPALSRQEDEDLGHG